MVAAAIRGAAVAGIAGSAISAGAAGDAAQTQSDAANRSADLQWQQYQQTRSDLAPYRDLGSSYVPQLKDALQNPLLSTTFNYGSFMAPTAAEAAATPGYQFTLDQGLKAAQNSASARGLGASGAALKGASTYATGLADSTYGDTFNRALTSYTTNRNNALGNFTTNYGVASDAVNRLLGIVGTGQNAAALTGSLGAQATGNVGNTIMAGAASQAAGQVGAANAITSGISGIANGAQSALMLNKLFPTATAGTGASGATLYGVGSSGIASGIIPGSYGVGSNSYGFTG